MKIYSETYSNLRRKSIIRKVLIFILMVSIQVAEIPYIFTPFEGRGTYLCIALFGYLSLIYFFSRKFVKISSKLNVIFVLFVAINLFFTSYHLLVGDIKYGCELTYTFFGITQSIKVILFMPVYTIIKEMHAEDINTLFKWYTISFFFLVILAISLVVTNLLPIKPRLITGYTGGFRFAAFHDELIYFSYSALIAFLYLVKSFVHRSLFLLLLFPAYYILEIGTKSNALILEISIIVLTFFFLRIKIFRRFFLIFYILIGMGVIFGIIFFKTIVDLIASSTSLKLIFPRIGDLTSISSSALLIRWSILYSGISYFLHNFISMPAGLGKAANLKAFHNLFFEPKSQDSFGISAFLSDFVWLSVLFLCMSIFPAYKLHRSLQYIDNKRLWYFYIITLTLFTMMIHAGYTNITCWTILLLCYRAVTVNTFIPTKIGFQNKKMAKTKRYL